MDFGRVTPVYVYRMWGGSVSLEEIEAAMKLCLPVCRVEGSAARMRRCARSGELSAARLHRPLLRIHGSMELRSDVKTAQRSIIEVKLHEYRQ